MKTKQVAVERNQYFWYSNMQLPFFLSRSFFLLAFYSFTEQWTLVCIWFSYCPQRSFQQQGSTEDAWIFFLFYFSWDGERANTEVLKTVNGLQLLFLRDLQPSLKSAALIFMNLPSRLLLSCNNFSGARMMELNKASGNKPPRRRRWLVAFLWAAAEVNYFMAVSVTVTQPAGTSREKNNKKTQK